MEKFIISIVACSVMMSAVALLYTLISKALKNVQSPKWRYYSWVLIFIGFVTPFKPTFGKSAVMIDTGDIDINGTDIIIVGNYHNLNIGSDEMFMLLFLVWLIGFAVSLGITVFKQHSFVKSVNRLSKPVSREITKMADRLAVDMGIVAAVRTVIVKEVSSPMAVGFFKPVLILPDRSFSRNELHLILKHELVHIRRHDLFIKVFMTLCKSVHWFNPLVRLFLKNAEREGELYCDETVMRDEDEELKKLYCQSILNTVSAENKMNVRLVPAISSNFFFDKRGLKHRMKMILSFDKKYKLSIVCGLVLTLIALTGTVLAFSSEGGSSGDADYANTTFASITATTALSEDASAAAETTTIVLTEDVSAATEITITALTGDANTTAETTYNDFEGDVSDEMGEYSIARDNILFDGESVDTADPEAEISR